LLKVAEFNEFYGTGQKGIFGGRYFVIRLKICKKIQQSNFGLLQKGIAELSFNRILTVYLNRDGLIFLGFPVFSALIYIDRRRAMRIVKTSKRF